jgi:hypothetical protein
MGQKGKEMFDDVSHKSHDTHPYALRYYGCMVSQSSQR